MNEKPAQPPQPVQQPNTTSQPQPQPQPQNPAQQPQPPQPPKTPAAPPPNTPASNPPPPPAQQPPQVKEPPPPPPPKKPKTPSRLAILWTGLVMFIIGVIGGVLLFITFPKAVEKPVAVSPKISPTLTPTQITLPKDAVKISDCEDGKGELYASQKDMPRGPFYMLYKNKIIGIEFQRNLDKIENGKNYKNMSALPLQIDHINSSVVEASQSGTNYPRSYFDLYIIDSKTEQSIICEKPLSPTIEASPAAAISESIEITKTVTPAASKLKITITPIPSKPAAVEINPSSTLTIESTPPLTTGPKF